MLAGRYTLLEQPDVPLLERCLERRTGVVSVGAYNSGLLARPDVPEDAHYNYDQAPPEVLERARALAAVCRDFGVELPTAALQFPLRHPAVVNVTAGATSPEQVATNSARMEAPVPDELWDALEACRAVIDSHLHVWTLDTFVTGGVRHYAWLGPQHGAPLPQLRRR